MKWGNCLFFALKRFWGNDESYIAMRRSRKGRWFHFIWVKDFKNAEIEHFVPFEDLKFAWIHKIFFRGRIKTDDLEEKDSKNDSETLR